MPKLNFDSQIANLKKPLVQAPISNVATEQSQVLDKAKGYDPLSLAYKASRVIQQGTAQSGAKVGLALYDIAKRVLTGNKEPTALSVDPGAGKIERQAFKQFFGDERVSGITEDVINAENFIKENAPKLEGSKNLATRYAGKALSGAEKLGLTAPLVAGLTALDFTGIGGGKKKIAEELLKETTEEGAEQILKQSLKLSDDVAKEFAPKFAKATEPKAIDLILDEVDQVVKKASQVPKYQGEKDLTTKILRDLEGKTTVSKQYILNSTNRGELKQVERDLIRELVEKEGDNVNVADFAKKVKQELLPLKVNIDEFANGGIKKPKFESITLSNELRGNVKNYKENVYESPIKTSAGSTHFSGQTENYFGHTRIEDMADDQTRRVIEVQSDLYQKGNLERETDTFSVLKGDESVNKIGKVEHAKRLQDRKQEVSKLQQYNDPTAHFRMIREEVKQAAKDGKEVLQFPTGETAMKIEGLGGSLDDFSGWEDGAILNRGENGDLRDRFSLFRNDEERIRKYIVGKVVNNGNSDWIITDVLGDGKFKAVPKELFDKTQHLEGVGENAIYAKFPDWPKEMQEMRKETFDISGKVDTNNPIYKFYEKEVGKYLKNKYGAELVTDDKGVKWWEVKLNNAMGQAPVEAFGAFGGFEQDENGKWTFDPKKAGAGVLAFAGLKKGKEAIAKFGIDGLLKKELDDFTALPFEKQGEAFNDLSRQAQDIIMGMPPQEATTPLARVAEEIAQGKLKIKTPTDIKKDLLDELGGNYMRYFRNDKNLQSLDEIAGDIGVSEYELIDAVKSYQKPSEMANTWAKIDQLYSGQELPEETLLAEGQKRLEELRQQAQRLLLSPQPALRNTEQIQILDDIGSLADDTVKLKGLQEDRLLNLDNLNISKKAKDLIEDELEGLRSEIKDVTGDVLSNEQTIKFADSTAKYLNKAIGKEETLKWQGALLNLRQQVAKQAEDGIVSDDFIENLMVLKTVGTDIGRRLQSFSIGADPSTKRPLELILSKILKMSDNADDILKQAKGVDFNDYKQATEFYRKFFKPKVGDWVDLVRYNSMLSSPLTHMVNLFSNGVTSVLRPVLTKAVAGGLDFLGSMKTGKRTRFSGEALAYLKGYSSSYKEAFGRLTGVLKGERAFENIDLKQLPLTTKGVANKIENFLRVPLKALEASDQFFSALVEGGERSALNFRKGKGVKVFGIESKAKKEAGYTLFRQSTKINGQGNVLEAIDHATNVINHARGHSNPLISIPAKFTIPFVSTPMNIIKQSIEYSPLGFATMIGSADKLEQASKALIGSALFATAGALIVSNRMTWAEPTSEKDRDAYRENKMQPYSIKIGDKWVSYQKLPPILSMPLAITAMINDAWKNRKLSDNDVDLFLKSMAKYGQFMSDQSYLKSMGDLLEAFSGNEVALSKLIGNYPQQLVPLRALSGWVARLSDDLQRRVDYKAGFIDKQVQLLMQNIPGLSQSLPARLDSEGKPLKNEGRLINAFSPLKITTQSTLEEKRYRMIESAKKLERDTNEAKADLREQAEKLDAELLTMPKDQANRKVNGIKKTNPKLYEALKDTAKARKNKLNSVDRAIKALGVENGARAKFIFDMLNEYPTAEEKNKIIKQMKAKGLITDKVYQQMRKLKNSPL